MAQALEKRDAQSRYVIFGAGQNGYALTKFLGVSFFRCFIDNDSQKCGGEDRASADLFYPQFFRAGVCA